MEYQKLPEVILLTGTVPLTGTAKSMYITYKLCRLYIVQWLIFFYTGTNETYMSYDILYICLLFWPCKDVRRERGEGVSLLHFLNSDFYIYNGDAKVKGGFFIFSVLLHLLPLRFHCVWGCWDRTHTRTVAISALVVRRSNHLARSHLLLIHIWLDLIHKSAIL
jgi:hypothetical protein